MCVFKTISVVSLEGTNVLVLVLLKSDRDTPIVIFSVFAKSEFLSMIWYCFSIVFIIVFERMNILNVNKIHEIVSNDMIHMKYI